jgi:flagellar protein FlaG
MADISKVQSTPSVPVQARSVGQKPSTTPVPVDAANSPIPVEPSPPPTANVVENFVQQREKLEQVVLELNKYVQNERRDIQFSVDDQLGTTIIKVVDSNSGELIRQIPDATLIELARQAREKETLNLISTAS